MFVQFGCCGSDQDPICSVWRVCCHVIGLMSSKMHLPWVFPTCFSSTQMIFFCAPNCSLFVLLVFFLDQQSQWQAIQFIHLDESFERNCCWTEHKITFYSISSFREQQQLFWCCWHLSSCHILPVSCKKCFQIKKLEDENSVFLKVNHAQLIQNYICNIVLQIARQQQQQHFMLNWALLRSDNLCFWIKLMIYLLKFPFCKVIFTKMQLSFV